MFATFAVSPGSLVATSGGPVLAIGFRMKGQQLRDRSRRFALDVIDVCLSLGQSDLARLIRPQLLRAGTGVASNHRAAGYSRSRREFVSKFSVVIEEADESEWWLDVLETKRSGPLTDIKRLRQEAIELRAIFSASRKTAARKLRRPKE
jgi:four helix bundle protein